MYAHVQLHTHSLSYIYIYICISSFCRPRPLLPKRSLADTARLHNPGNLLFVWWCEVRVGTTSSPVYHTLLLLHSNSRKPYDHQLFSFKHNDPTPSIASHHTRVPKGRAVVVQNLACYRIKEAISAVVCARGDHRRTRVGKPGAACTPR